MVNGKVITVHGEMDFDAYQKSAVPYVEPERKEESSYHSLELVAVTHVTPGVKREVPAPSQYTLAPGKMLLDTVSSLDTVLGNMVRGFDRYSS